MELDERMKEGMDLKRFVLCLLRKWWVIIAAALAGAVFAGGVYGIMTDKEPLYQARVQYFINFDLAEDGKIQDYFNAYTWDGILKSDLFTEPVAEELSDVDTETLTAAVEVEGMSDIRLMPVKYTAGAVELADRIAAAYNKALIQFGEEKIGMASIEIWDETPAQLVKEPSKAFRAVLLGTVIGLFAGFLGLAIFYVLEDAFYTEKDVEDRFGVPVLGIRTRKKNRAFVEEERLNLKKLGDISLTETELTVFEPFREKGAAACELMGEEQLILLVPWGKRNGTILDHALRFLKKQDIKVAGVILTDADDGFLKHYYGGKRL